MTNSDGTVHLVGIGGMHMSAIAQILLAGGHKVSGSDLTLSPLTARLQALGATVYQGHAAEHLGDATVVVTTAAAKEDNPELQEARRRGLPLLMRHEMVARLMQDRSAVAVAGTHGKTTTSSLVALILERAGLHPAYLLGGEALDLGGNASPGGGGHIVVEADEYAGAFLAYHPQVAIVLNVEPDHLDYYGSEENLFAAFAQFMRNVPEGGLLIVSADSPQLMRLLDRIRPEVSARVERYSIAGRPAEWTAEAITDTAEGSSFLIRSAAGPHGRFTTRLAGRHHVANALAAAIACHALGVNDEHLRATLAEFRGVHRRFELIGEAAGVTIVDDYAHHPTEIAANLAAARARYPDRRLVAIFQPHTYSRTEYLLDGFRSCFGGADLLYLLQTFAARETPEAGIDAGRLAQEVRSPAAQFVATIPEAVQRLAQDLHPGDVCLTLGAGSVTQVGPLLLEELRSR